MKSWMKYILYKLYYVLLTVFLILFLNYAAAQILELIFKLLQNAGFEKYKALATAIVVTVIVCIVFVIGIVFLAKVLRPKIFGDAVTKPNDQTAPAKTTSTVCTCDPNDMPIGMLSIGGNKAVKVDLVTINNIRQLRIVYSDDQPLSQCYCQMAYCPICGGKIQK